jgi:hypothetical protein
MKRFTVCVLVLIAIAGTRTSSQSPRQATPAWGPGGAGLRLGISGPGIARSSGARFTVTLENTGPSDLLVNIGRVLGNGAMFSSAIHLVLTDPAGHTRDLEFFDLRYPAVAGWLGDDTMPVRRRATYSFPASLDQYLSEATGEIGISLPEGRHRITAVFEGNRGASERSGLSGLRVWTGTLRSGSFDFEVIP